MAVTEKTNSGPINVDIPQTDQIQQARSDLDKMREYFKAQRKVTIKVPKDRGSQFVQVNGYTYQIAAGIPVQVPEQIAAMLRDADVI
jgi:hypothetical protein